MSDQKSKAGFWKPGMPPPKALAPSTVTTAASSSSSVKVNEAKPTLSKAVLGMKFMKKKDESSTKVEPVVTDKNVTKDTSSTGPASGGSTFKDPYAELPGRRSFNGCNKAVERYYESRLEDLNYKTKSSTSTKELTVSDEDILKRCADLVGLPRGPNQGQRPQKPDQQYKGHNKVYKRDLESSDPSKGPQKKSRKH